VTRGKRDLAYAIDKHKNGYFIQVYFASSPNILGIYQTKLNLDKNILRSMVINVSK
jgi:ribosomal protein S6